MTTMTQYAVSYARRLYARCHPCIGVQCTILVLLALSVTGQTFAQTGTILPSPQFTALDSNGNPIASAKLCVYASGSSTPADTYADSGLAVANTNPVIMSSAGRATIFVPAGASLKLVLRQPGTDTTCATGSIL